MGIDSSIPSQVHMPQIPSVGQKYGQMLTLKNLMQQSEQNDLALGSMKRDMEYERRVADIMQSEPDMRMALQRISRELPPDKALKFTKDYIVTHQTIRGLDKDKAEEARRKLQRFSDEIDDVMSYEPAQRPAAYRTKLSMMKAAGDIPEGMKIPEEYDEELLVGWGNKQKRTLAALEARIKKLNEEEAQFDLEHKRKLEPSEVAEAEDKAATAGLSRTKAEQEQQAFEQFVATNDPAVSKLPSNRVGFDIWKKKQERESKLLTPEEEAQQIRLRQASDAPEESKDEKDYKYWQTLTRDANRRLTEENQKRIEMDDPPASTPSGTELAALEQTPEGPGVRRWGGGQKMPVWLAKQYVETAGGDKDEAARMALADGWDIRR